jgi:WD40 repeat protein
MNRWRFNFSVTQLLLLTAFVGLWAGVLTASWRVLEYNGLGSLAFSPDGRYLAAHKHRGGVRLWDLAEDVPSCRRLSLGRGAGYFHSDATRFLTPTTLVAYDIEYRAQPTVKVVEWDVVQDRLVKESELSPLHWCDMAVSFHGREPIVLSHDARQGALVLWDVDREKPSATFPVPHPPAEMAIAAGGKKLAAAVYQDSAGRPSTFVWDLQTKAKIQSLPSDDAIYNLAISNDGRQLAIQTWSDPEKTVVWNLDDGRVEWEIADPRGYASVPYQFSPNGSLMAGTDYDGSVRILDAVTGEFRGRLSLPRTGWLPPGEAVFAFSPHGQAMAAGDHDAIVLWDVDTKRRRTLAKSRRVETAILFTVGLLAWAVVWGIVARRRRKRQGPPLPRPTSVPCSEDRVPAAADAGIEATTATAEPRDRSATEGLPNALLFGLVLTTIAGVGAVVLGVASLLLTLSTSGGEPILVVFRSYGLIAGVFAVTRVAAGDLRRLTMANLSLLACILFCDCFTVFIATLALLVLRDKAARQFIASHDDRSSLPRPVRRRVR